MDKVHYGLVEKPWIALFFVSPGFYFFLTRNKFLRGGGGGRGAPNKGSYGWYANDELMLYSSAWNLTNTINIITSIGQYPLGIPWDSCSNVWFLDYEYWLPTTKETIKPNNKAPRGLNSIVLLLLFVMTVPAERPEYFGRDNFESLKTFVFHRRCRISCAGTAKR